MHYFLNYDTSDFEPNADALETASKRAMIESGRTDLEQWLDENVEDEAVFRLYDVKQRYRDEGGGPTSVKAIANYLRRKYSHMVDKTVRVNGRQKRLHALRLEWARRPESEWERAYLSGLEEASLKQ